jgi:hypothetical protein
VGDVDDFRAGNAGEEVFVPAGKPYHLMGEHRPADDEMVVIIDEPIEPDRHILGHHPTGELADLSRGDRADMGEVRRVAPIVVVDAPLAGASIDHLFLQQSAQVGVRHRLMGSQRNQVIHGSGARLQEFLEQASHQWHGHAACAIGDQDEHPLAVHRKRIQGLAHKLARLVFRETAIGEPFSQDQPGGCRNR